VAPHSPVRYYSSRLSEYNILRAWGSTKNFKNSDVVIMGCSRIVKLAQVIERYGYASENHQEIEHIHRGVGAVEADDCSNECRKIKWVY
jgi:hypothetical protein